MMKDPVYATNTCPNWLGAPLALEDDLSPAEQIRILDASIRKLEARRLQLTRDVQSRLVRIEALNLSLDELTDLKLEAETADQDERYGVPK